AKAQYPDEAITALAIIAASGSNMVEFISPCGNCRQILAEVEHRQKHPFRILLAGLHEVCILNSASDLLPFGFNANIGSSRP
ncbi:MAG: cytidine deaminase, partial [Tannerellaceae bacterium]